MKKKTKKPNKNKTRTPAKKSSSYDFGGFKRISLKRLAVYASPPLLKE